MCCHSALADVGARVDAGVSYTDNIRRVAIDETEEHIGVVGVELSWLEDSRRIDADVTVDGNFLHYRNDTYEDEFVGTGSGNVVLGIVPDHFTWLLQDSYGQAASDPFAPATPDTREDINYFTTGPDLIANIGDSNALRLFGRYSLTNYERSLFDSERNGAGLSLTNYLSSQSRLALQGIQEEIRFDDIPLSDYDSRNAYLSYNMDGARTRVGFEGGYSWLKLSDDTELTGPLARLNISRTVSAASRISASLGTQFSDSSQALRDAVSGPGSGGPTGVTSSPDPFENRFVELGWNFIRNRTGIDASASWNEDRYETQTGIQPQSDRTRIVYDLSISRQVTPSVSTNLYGTYTDEEFEDTQFTSRDFQMGATIDWQFGRSLGLSLSAERYERKTSDGQGEYEENRGLVTLFYRFREAAVR
jgi:hypothetical protein